MTTRPPYKKRLQEHLKETKDTPARSSGRIKQLGGKAEAGPDARPARPGGRRGRRRDLGGLEGGGGRPGSAARVRGTGEAEKMLKNAKTEYFNEFEEIATYTGIEALAEAVGDKRDRQAGARHPPRGGAHGEVPRASDPDAGQGRRQGGDPGRRAVERARPQEALGALTDRHPETGREETDKERLDRNLQEFLGELRVALPGVQVLFAFLLVVPFNQRFPVITEFQKTTYFVTLLLATVRRIGLPDRADRATTGSSSARRTRSGSS